MFVKLVQTHQSAHLFPNCSLATDSHLKKRNIVSAKESFEFKFWIDNGASNSSTSPHTFPFFTSTS